MGAMNMKMGKSPFEGRKKGTFIVKVDHCENETWQGNVVWAEENRSEHFRSALELIRLIDGAMSKGDAKKKSKEGTA